MVCTCFAFAAALKGTRKGEQSKQFLSWRTANAVSLPHLIAMKYRMCQEQKRRGSMFRNHNSKTRLEHENHPNKQETESISILSLYSFSWKFHPPPDKMVRSYLYPYLSWGCCTCWWKRDMSLAPLPAWHLLHRRCRHGVERAVPLVHLHLVLRLKMNRNAIIKDSL